MNKPELGYVYTSNEDITMLVVSTTDRKIHVEVLQPIRAVALDTGTTRNYTEDGGYGTERGDISDGDLDLSTKRPPTEEELGSLEGKGVHFSPELEDALDAILGRTTEDVEPQHAPKFVQADIRARLVDIAPGTMTLDQLDNLVGIVYEHFLEAGLK